MKDEVKKEPTPFSSMPMMDETMDKHGAGHKPHHNFFKEHAAGHKLNHEVVKSMCSGGMTKGK